MRKKLLRAVFLTAAGFFLALTLLAAHHGAGSFETERTVTLKGVVTEWIFAHPHCFLRFDVKQADGTTRSWMAETQNSTDMTRRGWSRYMFKAGEAVTVVAEPMKDGTPAARIRTVMLASGQTFTAIGSAPGLQDVPR
jgi:hypothetical protein